MNSTQTSSRILSPPPPGCYNLIIDNQVSKNLGMLRALPLIKRLGYKRFTFVYKWHKLSFPLTPYEYVQAPKDISGNQLVCITSQRIETRSYSIKDILHIVRSQRIGNFNLVVDRKDFVVRGWLRPLAALRHILYEYKNLSRDYQLKVFGKNFKPMLRETENVFFQEIAWIYHLITGKYVKKMEKLFVFDEETCLLPSWDILINLTRVKTTQFDRIKLGLSFWVEKTRTLERISDKIWNALREFNYDVREIEKNRRELLKKWEPIKMRKETLIALERLKELDEWRILRSEFLLSKLHT